MSKQTIGWIIVGSCLLWGLLRAGDLVEPNFVINFLAIGGFCLGIHLTKNNEADELTEDPSFRVIPKKFMS